MTKMMGYGDDENDGGDMVMTKMMGNGDDEDNGIR